MGTGADRKIEDDGVTILIPNLNGQQHLPRCLRALKRTTGVNFEILVVDNGSTDGGPEWLRENHPDVRVIALGENRGFSGGLMTGVRQCSRPLVCFLNNDTEVTPDWLSELVRTLKSDPTIGAVSSTLFYMHNPELINFGGGKMTRPGYGYQGRLGWPRASLEGAPEVEETLFPSGAAMLISRRLLLDCGGLDVELFPVYHEDVDLGWRLWVMGYRVVITGKSVVLHYEGGGTGPRPNAEWIARLGFRHSMRCSLKNYQARHLLPVLGVLMASQVLARLTALSAGTGEGRRGLISLPRALPRLLAGTLAAAGMIAGAWCWNLARIGDTLRQRKFIQSRRRRKDSELFQQGLIQPRPWFPFGVDPFTGWSLPFDQLFLQPELFPAEDSAIGRLSGGWGPIAELRSRRSRTLMYLSRCRLRVAPQTSGRIEVRVGLMTPANSGSVRVVCGENVSRWTALKSREPVTVSCPAVSNAHGELSIEIIADASGYSTRRRLWWCAVEKIKFIPDRPSRKPPEPIAVSVLIPTYNRASYLEDCLEALIQQSAPPREVIVVDDGSTDRTPEILAEFAGRKSLPFIFKTARQDNSGPGAARNRGLNLAAGNLIAFLGDDMIADPDWLKNHIAVHTKRGLSCAVCGFTDWDRERMTVTPLLEFINIHGHQFGFGHFRAGEEVPFTSLYTSNLSLPTRFLARIRFDDWFHKAAFEDCELGYRLCARGMRIIYEPGCLVHHRHPMTAGDFCRRQRMLGKLWVEMVERWPELKPYFPFSVPGRFQSPRLEERLVGVAERLLRECDRRQVKLPNLLYRLWLHRHFMTGVREAYRQRLQSGPPSPVGKK